MRLIKEFNIKDRYTVRSKSTSDIDEDLILKCLERPDSFHELEGFYSIIIKDLKTGDHILVSDITATNRIYYKKDHSNADFDIKIAPKEKVVLSRKAIRYYLKYRYIPSPFCFYDDHRTLEPGMVLRITKDNKEEILSGYDLKFNKSKISNEDFKQKIEEILNKTLKKLDPQKAGLFLSGGMDSSAVLYFIRRFLPDVDIKSFSVLFPGERFDENDFSDYVCKKVGVEREKFFLRPKDFIDFWSKMPDIFPQPVSTHTGAAYYKVAKDTDVDHIFSGMGGDELFGGDIKYFHCEKIRRFKENMKRNGIISDIRPFDEFLGFISFNDDELPLEISQKDELLDQLTWFNIRYWQTEYENYVINNICEKTGKRHIAPYIDRDFIEMALSIDNDLKIRGYIQRYIYRKWIQTIFGKDFAFRPSQGFSAPLNKYFKKELKGFLENNIESLCKREVLKDLIDERFLKDTLKELFAGRNVYNILLIHLVLEVYMRNFEKNENTVYIS